MLNGKMIGQQESSACIERDQRTQCYFPNLIKYEMPASFWLYQQPEPIAIFFNSSATN